VNRRFRLAMIGAKGVPASVGGVERLVEEMSARLVERGHDVTVYTRPDYVPKDTGNEWRGIRLRYTRGLAGKHTATLSHAASAVLDASIRGYDLIHVHSLGVAPLLPVARFTGQRVVFHLHGQEWRGGKWGPMARRYFRACETPALAFPHRVVVLSRVLQDYFRTVHRRSTIYIPNAVEVTPPVSLASLDARGLEPGSYLLAVGRLVPEKGLHELVAAHRMLAGRIRLVIVGDSSHSDDYADSLRAAAGPDVHFTGVVTGEPLAALYRGARALVQASHREGMPLVVLEAMAHGVPVVVSDIAEHRECVADAGHFFRTGSADDLGRLLAELLDDPHRLTASVEPARARIASEYAWPGVLDRVEAVYHDLVTGAR
jgi:glycosyltransferase involved in cell wall biosynthesis